MCAPSLVLARHLRLLDQTSLYFNVHPRAQTWLKWGCRPLREPRSRIAVVEIVMRQVEWGALPEKDRSDEAASTGHELLQLGLWLIKASFSKHHNQQAFHAIL